MIVQIMDHPYYWTDGIEIYSKINKKFKKLNGWKQTYLYRMRYPVKIDKRGNGKSIYFYKDDLKKYLTSPTEHVSPNS